MKFSCDTLFTEQKNHALMISRNLVKKGLEWNFDIFTYILRIKALFFQCHSDGKRGTFLQGQNEGRQVIACNCLINISKAAAEGSKRNNSRKLVTPLFFRKQNHMWFSHMRNNTRKYGFKSGAGEYPTCSSVRYRP